MAGKWRKRIILKSPIWTTCWAFYPPAPTPNFLKLFYEIALDENVFRCAINKDCDLVKQLQQTNEQQNMFSLYIMSQKPIINDSFALNFEHLFFCHHDITRYWQISLMINFRRRIWMIIFSEISSFSHVFFSSTRLESEILFKEIKFNNTQTNSLLIFLHTQI